MFFKIENWNFQHLFEKRILWQNFNPFINGYKIWKQKFAEWAEWVEILWGFTKFLFQIDSESFNFLSWKTTYANCCPNFPERFCVWSGTQKVVFNWVSIKIQHLFYKKNLFHCALLCTLGPNSRQAGIILILALRSFWCC